MKKIMILMLCLMGMMSMMQAQKPRLFVGQFSRENQVSGTDATAVREKVKEALTETMRFDLVDASSITTLGGTETAMLQQESADFVIMGNITDFSIKVERSENSTSYIPTLNYSITLTRVEDMSTVGTKTFTLGGSLKVGGFDLGVSRISATSEEEAYIKALKSVTKQIDKAVKALLPLEGQVILVDYKVEKKKVTRCYVELGSEMGVKRDDRFDVLKSVQRGGRSVYQKVGELEVIEVVDETMSYCRVKKDGDKIYLAMEELIALDEESQKQNPLKIRIKP